MRILSFPSCDTRLLLPGCLMDECDAKTTVGMLRSYASHFPQRVTKICILTSLQTFPFEYRDGQLFRTGILVCRRNRPCIPGASGQSKPHTRIEDGNIQ